MRNKKMWSLLLAAAMTMGILAGCVKESSENEKQEQSSQQVSEEADSSESSTAEDESTGSDTEPTKLVWYRFAFNSSGDYTTALEHVTEQLNEYLKDKINVTVEMKCFSASEYGTKLSMAMAANEQVDIFWTGSTYSMNTPKELVADGSVYDLTDLVKNNSTLFGYLSEDFWDLTKYDDKIYFVPNFKDMGTGYGIMFNAEAVEKANFDISSVKELADLEPYYAAIKDEYSLPHGIGTVKNGPVGVFSIFTGNSSYIYTPFSCDNQVAYDLETGKVVNVVETDEYEETLYTLRDFNQKGYIPSWLATDTDNSKHNELVSSNDYGVENAGVYPDYESYWVGTYGYEGKYLQLSDVLLDRDGALGSAYAIPSYSENAEKAVEFLALLETDRTVGDLARFGVEGENYTVDSDGFISVIADSGYSFPAFATTSLLNMSLTVGQSETMYDATKQFVEDETQSPLLGFAFDSSKVDAEIAAIKEVATSYALLNTGDMDVATVLPEYRDALKDAGIDRIIEEAQRQIDEYMQSK